MPVKEQCLNFSNDSMLFLIYFRDLKKCVTERRTHGRTDPHIDAWTHLKMRFSFPTGFIAPMAICSKYCFLTQMEYLEGIFQQINIIGLH